MLIWLALDLPITFYLIYSLVKKSNKQVLKKEYFVSILIPCFNESKVIIETLESIRNQTYKNYEVLIADDGSTDDTVKKVSKYINSNKLNNFRVVSGKHKGRPDVLNVALPYTKGDIIVNVDADTLLEENAIERIITPFQYENVGSVSGNIRPRKRNNSLLTKLQELEYALSQEVFRFSQGRSGNCIIIPGAFCAYRKKCLRKFEVGTLSEDFDTSSKILKQGLKNIFVDDAIAYTAIPTNLSGIISQRLRWQEGGFQVVSKYLFDFPRKSTKFWYFWFFFSALQGAFIRMFVIVLLPMYLFFSTATILIILINMFYTTLLYSGLIYFHNRKYRSGKFLQHLTVMPIFTVYFFFIWTYATFTGQICALKEIKEWLKIKRE